MLLHPSPSSLCIHLTTSGKNTRSDVGVAVGVRVGMDVAVSVGVGVACSTMTSISTGCAS